VLARQGKERDCRNCFFWWQGKHLGHFTKARLSVALTSHAQKRHRIRGMLDGKRRMIIRKKIKSLDGEEERRLASLEKTGVFLVHVFSLTQGALRARAKQKGRLLFEHQQSVSCIPTITLQPGWGMPPPRDDSASIRLQGLKTASPQIPTPQPGILSVAKAQALQVFPESPTVLPPCLRTHTPI
jgi:hypothetical protein